MKITRSVFLCCLCLSCFLYTYQLQAQSCSAPTPVEASSLLGTWGGYFSFDGELHPFQIDIRQGEEGLIATSSLNKINIQESAFTTWICKSNEVHMRLDLPDQRVVKMIGSPKGQQFSGRLVYYPSPESTVNREVFALKKSSTGLFNIR